MSGEQWYAKLLAYAHDEMAPHDGSTTKRRRSITEKSHDYGEPWMVAATMWDASKTEPEIVDGFYDWARVAGFFEHLIRPEYGRQHSQQRILATLQDTIERGWVTRNGDRYSLTGQGRNEVGRMMADMRKARALIASVAEPETVSKATLAAHLGLAAIKLPAGLLSGSSGLLSDAIDTLLDGLASLLVYAGLCFDRERAVNAVLVVLMLVTGGLTTYQAVQRLFLPIEPAADWLAFGATLVSALVCALLYVYQRLIGLRSGSMALITQSVDSRNHVIVAISVTAGLIAAQLDFPLLDKLVGLGVAALILQAAVELAIELIRSLGEEKMDLGRYQLGLLNTATDRYKRFREDQLQGWMLYRVQQGEVSTRAELEQTAQQAVDWSDNPVLRQLGLVSQPWDHEIIQQSIDTLLTNQWITGNEKVALTPAGQAYLRKRLS